MTTQEFSNTFDTLLNSYNSQGMFGEQASKGEIVLDEYEKSVLLTQAQDIIVKQYFEGGGVNGGFDDSTRRQIDFSNLITVEVLTKESSPTITSYDERSVVYKTPAINIGTEQAPVYQAKVLYILNEKIVVTTSVEGVTKKRQYIVVPINYKEYDRQMSKAYAQPLKKQAWRLFQDSGVSGNSTIDLYSEIIPVEGSIATGEDPKYKIRYIRRPKPIVLVDLEFNTQSDLEIDGVKTVSECELNPIMHMDILNKAVELAYTTRGSRSSKSTDKD